MAYFNIDYDSLEEPEVGLVIVDAFFIYPQEGTDYHVRISLQDYLPEERKYVIDFDYDAEVIPYSKVELKKYIDNDDLQWLIRQLKLARLQRSPFKKGMGFIFKKD